jgi:hypothetical protein
MSIIDKLDKKISDKKNKKRLKEEEERLEYEKTQKLFKPISNFGTDVYKKNLADDFVKLEKLVKKHTQNLKAITIDSYHYGLQSYIKIELPWGLNYTQEARIQFIHKNTKSVSTYNSDLKSIKAYKFLDTNFCLIVSESFNSNSKKFELRDKEKAYEYFIDLFQKEIISFGEEGGYFK